VKKSFIRTIQNERSHVKPATFFGRTEPFPVDATGGRREYQGIHGWRMSQMA
jgi:hypothetical protein